jgi:uncharacterized protein (TIGR02265 family)
VAGYKGVGVVWVRQQLRRASPEVQLAVVDALTDAERRTYQECTAGEWVPIELMNRLSSAAAPRLFPGDPDPLRRLGRELARDNLGGVYSFLVRLLTVPFLVEQTTRLWRTYHQAGDALSHQYGPREVELVVTGYPELPERFRHQTAGFVEEAVRMTGAHDVRVEKSDADPARWTWQITWS